MKKIGILIMILFLIGGCSKLADRQSSVTTTTIGPSTIVGTIQGQVVLSTDGVNIDGNNGNIAIILEDTSYSAVTDVNGFFTIQNVLIGTYTMNFSKDGFDTWKTFNATITGTGTYYFPSDIVILHKSPTVQISDLTSSQYISGSNKYIKLSCTGSNEAGVKYISYISTSLDGKYYKSLSLSYDVGTGKYIKIINSYVIGNNSISLASGTTYYIKVKAYRGSYYYDYLLKEDVYPSSSAWSNITSCVMP